MAIFLAGIYSCKCKWSITSITWQIHSNISSVLIKKFSCITLLKELKVTKSNFFLSSRVFYKGGGFSRVDTVVSTLTFSIHNILALGMVWIKVIMQGKLFQRCTHLLYCSVLSLDGNVNTRRMSQPDMGTIFHKKINEIFWS